MIEAAYEALFVILDPTRMLWVVFGVMVGLVVGIIPGLGGTVGMALLLPFIFGMDPFTGIALLIGMTAVTHTGDTFPSILIGVPGSSGSQATIMDGYPLAQRGEAGRALGAAFTASAVGGVIGAVTLLGTISVARPLILALGQPELFMFTMLGLSMVGVLAKGSASAGVASGMLGLLLGLIGIAPATPAFRFTYDSLYLYDGIPLPVLALGIFALPEMIDLVAARRSISTSAELRGGQRAGMLDAWRNRWLVLRSSAVGTVVGVIPGLGGSVVDWIAYGITKRTSRDTSMFGRGDIRGVIGPESANNAKEGGTLIPTLLFGIPGSGSTAILLGGLTMFGLQAGPQMVTDHLDVTLTIVWTLVVANLLGASACLLLSGKISRLSLIPASRLVPFLLVIMTVAAYQSTRHWGDILFFLSLGILGWAMKHVGWPRAPMLIGFVLAKASERYLHLSISLYGFTWFTRPIVFVLVVIVASLVFGEQITMIVKVAVRPLLRRARVEKSGSRVRDERLATGRMEALKALPGVVKLRLLFTVSIMALFVYTAWTANTFPSLARYMPLTASLAGVALCFFTLIGDFGRIGRGMAVIPNGGMDVSGDHAESVRRAAESSADLEVEDGSVVDARVIVDHRLSAERKRSFAMLAWIVGFIIAIFLVGIFLATGMFLVLFLRGVDRASWRFTLLAGGATLLLLRLAGEVLSLRWPTHLITVFG